MPCRNLLQEVQMERGTKAVPRGQWPYRALTVNAGKASGLREVETARGAKGTEHREQVSRQEGKGPKAQSKAPALGYQEIRKARQG